MAAKKKRRKKKSGNFALGALLTVIVIAVAVVLAWQLRGYFERGAATAVARATSLGNYYEGTLVVARNERLYEAENSTRIDFVAGEGSRVSRAGVICKVYSSGFNQTEISKLRVYREQIQQYHINQVMSSYIDAALDSENREISELALQVRTLVQERGTGNLANLENQLASALNSRKSYLRQKYPDDQSLSQLYKIETDQLKKIESWTTTYTADGDCFVSFYTDGYENAVNSNTFGTLTPADVRAVVRGVAPEQSTISRGSDPIFRTVVEDEWYALFLCQDKDWNPVVGESYKIQLEGFGDYVVSGSVVSFSRIGGDLLLRMRVTQSVEPVLNIRSCGATVGDHVTGLYVPVSALYSYENMLGVVVADGGAKTFVPVTVISYTDQNTAFVRPTIEGSPLQDGRTVMLFGN